VLTLAASRTGSSRQPPHSEFHTLVSVFRSLLHANSIPARASNGITVNARSASKNT
jgi:hypothetical protein